MGTDIGTSVRYLLLDCRNAGIEIELDGENLQVRGSKQRTDLYDQIKRNKATIVQAMTYLPDAIETHYLSRLRQGSSWLGDCMKHLERLDSEQKVSDKLITSLSSNLMKWALIDDEMRRLYPEYRGCPLEDIGGCDFSYIPVKCQECADD